MVSVQWALLKTRHPSPSQCLLGPCYYPVAVALMAAGSLNFLTCTWPLGVWDANSLLFLSLPLCSILDQTKHSVSALLSFWVNSLGRHSRQALNGTPVLVTIIPMVMD